MVVCMRRRAAVPLMLVPFAGSRSRGDVTPGAGQLFASIDDRPCPSIESEPAVLAHGPCDDSVPGQTTIASSLANNGLGCSPSRDRAEHVTSTTVTSAKEHVTRRVYFVLVTAERYLCQRENTAAIPLIGLLSTGD